VRRLRLAHQAEVGDGQVPRVGRRALAVAVAEGVELFDVADGEAGLCRDPAPEAELERGIAVPVQEAGGQGGDVRSRLGRRQDARPALRDGHDDGIEAQRQSARHGGDDATGDIDAMS
jgi:hypothetical protein